METSYESGEWDKWKLEEKNVSLKEKSTAPNRGNNQHTI